MKNSEYWKDRMAQLELNALKKGEEYYKNLQEQYDKVIHNINKDITVWYERLAQNNEISLAEAKKLLDKNELKEFRWTLQDYMKYGEENGVNQNWIKELENASAKHHINQLQSLQIQMKQHLERLANAQEKSMKGTLSDIYLDTYYHTAYEVQKGFNSGWSFNKLDTNRIEKVLNQGWLDGKNFSDRIWANKEKLVNTLNTELTQMMIRSESPDRAIKVISATMNVSKRQAGRLVMTESSMIASVSQKDCFESLGVKAFEIVGTLDMNTCETCGSLDGRYLSMTDYKVGETAPPFHANCRCCIAPYFPDDEGNRFARDKDGKSHYIDSHIKYDDWKKKFVDNKNSTKKKKDDRIKNKFTNNKNLNIEIESAQNKLPEKTLKLLEDTQYDVSIDNSCYDRKKDKIYLLDDSNQYEILHEIGHAIETKLDVLHDKKYIEIQKEGLEEINPLIDIQEIQGYEGNKFVVDVGKFISEYQRKVYEEDVDGNALIDYNKFVFNSRTLGEYFSEGFRCYFEDNELLKNKDMKLFNYIEEILNE